VIGCLSWFLWVAWLCSLSGGLRIIFWVWCYTVFEWMPLVGFIVWMHYLISCWECFALLRTLGGIKCYVRFSVPRNLVKILSHVWSSGKGSSSPVWSTGRGLVRVLYPLACVKQWGREKCFTLFRLIVSIVPDVRCIDVFTHNSLRNKADSLAAIVGHIEPSVLGN